MERQNRTAQGIRRTRLDARGFLLSAMSADKKPSAYVQNYVGCACFRCRSIAGARASPCTRPFAHIRAGIFTEIHGLATFPRRCSRVLPLATCRKIFVGGLSFSTTDGKGPVSGCLYVALVTHSVGPLVCLDRLSEPLTQSRCCYALAIATAVFYRHAMCSLNW